jgi:hypothetical protein
VQQQRRQARQAQRQQRGTRVSHGVRVACTPSYLFFCNRNASRSSTIAALAALLLFASGLISVLHDVSCAERNH